MKWLIRKYDIDARFCVSIHDEVSLMRHKGLPFKLPYFKSTIMDWKYEKYGKFLAIFEKHKRLESGFL